MLETRKRSNGILQTTASNVMALLAVVVLSSCIKNSTQELQAVETEQERSTLSLYDLHTFVTDSGFYKYEFATEEMHQYDNLEEPYIYFPHGLDFKMYDNEGTVMSSSIKCKNARYYKKKNLWELNNDVVAVTAKGDVLKTEQMFWNTDERRIYSDKFVKITTKNQVITGVGFESDDSMSKYEIKHPGGEIELESTTN